MRAVGGDPPRRTPGWIGWLGVLGALLLIGAAALLPRWLHVDPLVGVFPPLRAYPQPVFGPVAMTRSSLGGGAAWVGILSLIGALAVAVLALGRGLRWSERLAWGRLLGVLYAGGLAWLVALAAVRGRDGLTGPLDTTGEYVPTARRYADQVTHFLHEFVDRINSPHGSWDVHVSGHPPGAVLFFVGLLKLHITSDLGISLTVIALAASTPLAVVITLRRLGAEKAARAVAPLLVLGPAAVWSAVSADAVFAVVTAWGLCLVAVSQTAVRRATVVCAGVGAGVALVGGLYLSYGMAVMIVPAVAIVVLTRRWARLIWPVLGGALVVLFFSLDGFLWWAAYPQLRARYYDGTAAQRPTSYWLWGNLAAFAVSAGPVAGAAVAALATRGRRWWRETPARPVLLLSAAGALCVVLADVSLMSKAEVERIWLPFVPWLLVGTALFPPRWRRTALGVQIAVALGVELGLHTYW